MPELVEKKEPPIITIIKKTKCKFSGLSLREKPVFERLLVRDKNSKLKLLLKLKKTKKITNKVRK